MGLKSEWVCVGWLKAGCHIKCCHWQGNVVSYGVELLGIVMPLVWRCGMAEVWYSTWWSMVCHIYVATGRETWYGMVWNWCGMAEVWCGTWWSMVCHIKCCHCHRTILPFLAPVGHKLCFFIVVLYDIVLAILWSWSMNMWYNVVFYGSVCFHISSYPMVWYCKVEYCTAWYEWYYAVFACW